LARGCGDGDDSGHADAALVAACAAFHAAFDRERAARAVSDEESDGLGRESDEAYRLILGAAPVTAAGLTAKASTALTRLIWEAAPAKDTKWRGQASPAEQAELECLALVAGRALP
jgi:hypothetical protein